MKAKGCADRFRKRSAHPFLTLRTHCRGGGRDAVLSAVSVTAAPPAAELIGWSCLRPGEHFLVELVEELKLAHLGLDDLFPVPVRRQRLVVLHSIGLPI